MTMKIFLILIFTIAVTFSIAEDEPKVYTLEFDDLGPTLLELNSGEKQVPTLMYQLPMNFSADKQYPVFVFIAGGDARNQKGGGLGRGVRIVGGKDYIVVTLPLYRNTKKLKKEAIFGDLLIGADDYPAIKRAYQPMLNKFFETVPQARKTGNVMGGFSNGAHTTGVLISCQDEVTLKHFSQFVLVDGGIWMSGLLRENIKKCRFLGLYGDTDEYWTRPVLIQQFKNMKAVADAQKIDFELVVMKGIGHRFPGEYDEAIREWLQK